MTDINRKLNLVQTITKNIVSGINFDLEIAQDHSKYTSYLLGISTAGIGVCLLNIRNTLQPSWFLDERSVYYFLLITLLVFIISIFVGIWAKRCVIKALMFKRVQMTLVLRQEADILSMNEIKDDLNSIHLNMIRFLYLSGHQQKQMIKHENGDTSLTNESHLIIAHEILIGLGFLLVLFSILPKPPL